MAGATIHKVTKDLKESAQRHMVTNVQRARIEYKCYQLLQSLRVPEGHATQYSNDPASLMEIIRRQHNTRRVTIVSDAMFAFFKYLYCKVKKVQTYEYLQSHRKNMLSVTELQIKSNEQIIELWCQLFQDTSASCRCEDDTESETVENDVNFNEQLLDFELEECLVMDMLDKVIHYFASVHISDVLCKYKSVKISKQKSTSL